MWNAGPLPDRYRHRSLLHDLLWRSAPLLDCGLACLQRSVHLSPSLPEFLLTFFLGLGTWISPPHEDTFGPEDFLQDVQDGMAAAAALMEEDDVPMP
jgi:hypothetical protein